VADRFFSGAGRTCELLRNTMFFMFMSLVYRKVARQPLSVVFLSQLNDAMHSKNSDVTRFIIKLESFNHFPTIAPVVGLCAELTYQLIAGSIKGKSSKGGMQ
jgi:hypothetical protein